MSPSIKISDIASKFLPDLVVLYLLFIGSRIQKKIASRHIRDFLTSIKCRSDLLTDEKVLLRLFIQIRGLTSDFAALVVVSLSLFVTILTLLPAWTACFGVFFGIGLLHFHFKWSCATIDSVEEIQKQQKLVIIVVFIVSISLKVFMILLT